MGGYVMQLQNFSVNDGEGIRTTIFLAGCPLRCLWCSNPEGQTLENCMTSYMSAEEVVGQIKGQMVFYRHSGGGVTFSGGEPTAQLEFLGELAEKLYDMGVSLAIETCGYFEFDEVSTILRKMDLIFMDIKSMDEEKHLEYTGVSNQKILDNLTKTARLGIPIVIRIPLIGGVNAGIVNLRETFFFIKREAPGAKVELLPYHRYGEEKYQKLGLPLPPKSFACPSKEDIEKGYQLAEKMGLKTISYK